jgi:hypothetical protein
MIIDNKDKLVAEKFANLLFLGLLAIVVVALYIFDLYKDPVWGRTGIMAVIVVSAVYLSHVLWGIIRNYHYFYFSDESAIKLVFRYYSLTPFFKQLRTIEIKKEDFYNSKVQTKASGLQEYLILFQKTPKGIAKYPGISISLLSKKNKESLLFALGKYQKQVNLN